MDDAAKKTALRMIPYGLYVLTARDGDDIAAATVNWVTQASFAPPLVVVGVKADTHSHAVVESSGAFCLNVLGKGQGDVAFTFFKPVALGDGELSGQAYHAGEATGAPVLDACPAHVECRVVEIRTVGDHSVVIGEVVGAGVASEPEGRADDATLWMRELGERVFYGG